MNRSRFSEIVRRWRTVKDPDGREIVESIVIQAERDGRSPGLHTNENVFRQLRKKLGLAESRSQSTRGSATGS